MKKQYEYIPYSPIYGYETKEQFDRLKELKHGPEYNSLWAEIKKQIENKGKIEIKQQTT